MDQAGRTPVFARYRTGDFHDAQSSAVRLPAQFDPPGPDFTLALDPDGPTLRRAKQRAAGGAGVKAGRRADIHAARIDIQTLFTPR